VSGGQIAALIFAILLLLPGECFLIFGIGFATDQQFSDVAYAMLPIAAAILALAGFLFWVALRRRRTAQGGPPDAAPPP
jgi:membrane protein implicated in regulation of membrane protease activity